jgi:hypothetical protein
VRKSPFRFPESYTLDDRAVFFGRDQEITELYRRDFENSINQVPKERNVIAKGLPLASIQTISVSSEGTSCVIKG